MLVKIYALNKYVLLCVTDKNSSGSKKNKATEESQNKKFANLVSFAVLFYKYERYTSIGFIYLF